MSTYCHTVEPFTIETSESQLDDLRHRLKRTRWPDALPGAGWRHGAALEYVQELAAYWQSGYDWRVCEAELNALTQFTTILDGQRIHFLHVRSSYPDACPLLLVHGWPGSVVEFLDVIEALTKPERAIAFHLVIPSLPGFAFSGPTQEPGWTTRRTARAFAQLMSALGYDRYGVQGGDWGARVAPDVGRLVPDRVLGVHVNAATAGFIPVGPVDEEQFDAADRDRLARLREFRANGSAYYQLQASRPQTPAYALTDSPVGLLAWIAEKLHDWSHDPTRIDRDRLLTNVMLYWLTGTANSAARIFYEHARVDPDLWRSDVPTGVAVFAEDLAIRRSAEQFNTIVHWSEFDRGGHFAALEEPDLLVADIQSFFTERRTT